MQRLRSWESGDLGNPTGGGVGGERNERGDQLAITYCIRMIQVSRCASPGSEVVLSPGA